MATTNSIGTTGRDYSTLQSWEDAIPATPTGGYIGECYNDSEFTATLTIAGHTTSSTNFIKLTAAAGQSFADHANKTTNPLRYNQSVGVGVTSNPNGPVILASNAFVTISRLQVKNSLTTYNSNAITADTTDTVINQCILDGAGSIGVSVRCVLALKLSGKAVNCLVIHRRSSGGGAAVMLGAAAVGALLYNCTIVAPSDLAGKPTEGIEVHYSTNEIKNCAVFGFTNDSTSGTVTPVTSFTDDTTPRSGFTGSKTYANQFENTTAAASDFRVKSGADLIDAGTDISGSVSESTTDIIGTARTTYDIGAWEFASAAAPQSRTPTIGTASIQGSGSIMDLGIGTRTTTKI